MTSVTIHVHFAVVGMLVALALHHALVYLDRREDKHILRFVFLLLSFAFLLAQQAIIPFFDPDSRIISMGLRVPLDALASGLTVLALLLYAYYALDLQPLRRLLLWGYIIAILWPLLLSIPLYQITKSVSVASYFNTAPAVLYGIVAGVYLIITFFDRKQQHHRRKWQRYGFVSVLLFCIGMIAYSIFALLTKSHGLQALTMSVGCSAMALVTAYSLNVRIHEEHRSKLAARQRQPELSEVSRTEDISKLLAGLSHEISHPLLSLSTPLENLDRYLERIQLDQTAEEKLHGYVNRIRTNVEHMRSIIKNLKALYFSGDLPMTQIDVERTVVDVIETWKHRTDKAITFHLHLDPEIPVRGNSEGLVQILTNLVSNAIDAIEETGEITIGLHLVDGVPMLEINDTGAGLSEEALGRVFDAFYSTKEMGQGMGLGLYIVKDLVQKMGWRIDIASKPGRGTAVTLIF